MTIRGELKHVRELLRQADEALDISGLVMNGQTYWLEHHWDARTAYWHAVEYYFRSWLLETQGSVNARKIANSPEAGTVIGEFVSRMMD
mgnify:CR=1 FL=1